MRKAFVCLIAALLTQLFGCAPATPKPPPTGCDLRVDGARIVNQRGDPAVLHGPSLGTWAEMEARGLDPLRETARLAAAGAGLIRLSVDDGELRPTYVPLKLLPLVAKTEALNMVLLLSFRNVPTDKLDKQIDQSEDFLRLVVPALRGRAGVWIEPLERPIDAPDGRRRAIAARLVDIVRGQGDTRIVLVGQANWLTVSDPAINTPFTQRNVVYAIRGLRDFPDALGSTLPRFMPAPASPEDAKAAAAAGVGTATATTDDPDGPALWKTSRGCD